MQQQLTTAQTSAYVDFGFRLPGQQPAEWAAEYAARGGNSCRLHLVADRLVVEATGSPEAEAYVAETIEALVWRTHQRAYDAAVAAHPIGSGSL